MLGRRRSQPGPVGEKIGGRGGPARAAGSFKKDFIGGVERIRMRF